MNKTFNYRIVTDLNTNNSKVNDLKICIHAKIQTFIAKSEILLFRKKNVKTKIEENTKFFKFQTFKFHIFKFQIFKFQIFKFQIFKFKIFKF